MKRFSISNSTAFGVSAQNTVPAAGYNSPENLRPARQRLIVRKNTLFVIGALSVQLLLFSNTVIAQERQDSKYQSYPPAMRQKLLFQDTVKNQAALIKTRYQKQIDSLIMKEMDGRKKWALINRLTQERNDKLLQISELVKSKMRIAITPKQKEQ